MIINGRKHPSAEVITEVGVRLNVGADLIDHWLKIEKETSPKFFGRTRLDYFQPMTSSRFAPIKDWFYYGILELIRTRNFQSSPDWIANRLNISVSEASSAIGKMETLGFIQKSEDGQLQNISGTNSNISDGATSADRRALQRQILNQSLSALDTVDLELRDHTAMTVAIHTSRLAEAKEKIAQFRRELASLLSEGENPDEVYQLSIGLFPVSKPLDATDSAREGSDEN